MSMLDFYIRVTKALDEIGAPYMIVGAFGGTIFGITRATNAKAKEEIEKGDTSRQW